METLQNVQAADLQELTPSLYDEFLEYVDRGEKTTHTYITNLRQFIAWTKYNDITKPTRRDIIAYRDYLQQEHPAIKCDPNSAEGWAYRTDRNGNPLQVTCKPATAKLYLQTVRQFFNWTAAAGIYPNVAANVHLPKVTQDAHKKDALTPADVLTIEKSIAAHAAAKTAAASYNCKDTTGRIERATEQGKRLFALYQLAVTAGLRTVELSRANIKDIESRDGKAFIYVYGKGHTEADTKKPIAPEVYNAIRDYLNSRTDRPTASSPLFVATGNRSGGKRLATTTISTMLKRAMQQAGYNSERLTAHSLRHTAGRNVMQLTGNNIYLTQQYMRHNSPKTTEIYLDNDTEQQQDAIAQELYRAYHGQDQNDAAQLQDFVKVLTAAQLQQLTGIARGFAAR